MRKGCKQCLDWQNVISRHKGMLQLTLIGGAICLLFGFGAFFVQHFYGQTLFEKNIDGQGLFDSSIGGLACGFWGLAAILFAVLSIYLLMVGPRFHFLDKTDEIHCHRTMPVVVQLDSADPDSKRYLWIDPQFEHPKGEETEHGVLPLNDFTVESHILEVHLGNLRKKYRVWSQNPASKAHTWWIIVRRKGNHLEVATANSSQSITAFPREVLLFMRQAEKISTAFFLSRITETLELIENERAGTRELLQKLEDAVGRCDWLSIGITRLKTELQESQRATRSPIGQMARERLEALLSSCSVGESDCWMRGEPTPTGKAGYERLLASQPHPNPPEVPGPETT